MLKPLSLRKSSKREEGGEEEEEHPTPGTTQAETPEGDARRRPEGPEWPETISGLAKKESRE